jgi:hypothetical protein
MPRSLMVGRDSVEPKLDFLGRSHGSTESRPTVFVEGGNAIEPQARRYTLTPNFAGGGNEIKIKISLHSR